MNLHRFANMSKKLLIPFLSLLVSLSASAQLPEDVIRMSWTAPSGTARHQAIGGAMGSLGGEITSAFVNPAGLGFYKVGEFVLTPGISFLNTKTNYLGNEEKSGMTTKFNYGTSGFVFAHENRYSRWTSSAYSLTVNRVANFNNHTVYKGTNDYSSFTEPMANEFFQYYTNERNANPFFSDAEIVDRALNSPEISLTTKMGLYTYLIDIDSSNGGRSIISRAEQAGALNQENDIVTSGGITEINFGFASNMDDKIYLGASIGVPIVNYKRNTTYTETDATGTGNNDFTSVIYKENSSSKGVGVNARLGVIFKPANQIRIGLAMTTPSLYALTDKFSASLENTLDTSQDHFSVSSSTFGNGEDAELKYDLITPWKFLVSGSYVLHEIEDVRKQKGFITADVEYVTYTSSRFRPGESTTVDDPFKEVNEVVKEIYKGSFNFRVGGELKFNTLMTRLGFAWYGSPYEDDQLTARKMNLSGGLGYRNKGIFVDLTYVHNLNKDVNFPYRIERQNVYSDVNESNGNVLLTFGIKF